MDEKVRLYYVLSNKHAENIDSFVVDLADGNSKGLGANFIIETNDRIPVGIITSHVDRTYFGEYFLKVACAILPEFRNQGYAGAALKSLIFIMQPAEEKRMILIISEDNIPSQSVARACGFEKSPYFSFLDPEHPEVGAMFRWIRNIHFESPRDILGNKGFIAQRAKDYIKALALFEQALKEEYDDSCIFSDAMIYSNMGMLFSSCKDYIKAQQYLMMAWTAGCQNPTVKKELDWLKDEVEVFQIQRIKVNYGNHSDETEMCDYFSGLDEAIISVTKDQIEILTRYETIRYNLKPYEEDFITETKIGFIPSTGESFRIVRTNKKMSSLIGDDTITFASLHKDGYAVHYKLVNTNVLGITY